MGCRAASFCSRCSLLFHANLEVKAHGDECPFTSTDNVLNAKGQLASCGRHCSTNGVLIPIKLTCLLHNIDTLITNSHLHDGGEMKLREGSVRTNVCKTTSVFKSQAVSLFLLVLLFVQSQPVNQSPLGLQILSVLALSAVIQLLFQHHRFTTSTTGAISNHALRGEVPRGPFFFSVVKAPGEV